MRPAETGDTARDEMENTCPVRSATASMRTDKQEDQQVMKSEKDWVQRGGDVSKKKKNKTNQKHGERERLSRPSML